MDTVLSDTGLQQGEAVGQYLRDIRFDTVFVSNLKRALQVRQIHLFNGGNAYDKKMRNDKWSGSDTHSLNALLPP